MDKNVPAGAAVLLGFIYETETSRKLPQCYDVIYAHNENKLPKPLTSMTLAEVQNAQLSWVGQRSIWGTVDAGHDDGGSSDGNFVLGDFGFGYGTADGITARFSAGGLHSDQDLDVVGSVRQKGFYMSPEVSADLGGDVFVTLGGYWGKSSIDSKRGYLNGATLDYSNGDTDAETWGAKVRFDWLNAFTINETAITPYVGLSYARTKVDG
jgi:hypothetical protein